MTIHIQLYQIVMILAAILALIVLLVGWPRRKSISGVYFIAFLLSVTFWLVSSTVESFVTAQSTRILWAQISYIGFIQVYPYLFLFVVSYIRQSKIHPSMIMALMVIPFITLILVWTNSYHGWVWSGFTQGSIENNVLIFHHGFWFWVYVVYLYSVLLTGVIYLIRTLIKAPPAIRRQLLIILAGVIFPVITGSMYVLGLEPIPGMDITPTGLVFTGMFLAWGLLRYQLLDLLPVARATLVEQLQDGMIVLDMRGRIVDINRATRKLLGWNRTKIFGQDIALVSPALAELLSSDSSLLNREVIFPDKPDIVLDVQVSVLLSHAHQEMGKLLLLRDITERKLADEALREAEWKFYALFENGPIGVAYHRMIYDAAGKPLDYYFIDANVKYIQLTGVNPIGKTATVAFPGIEHDSFDWIGTFGHVAQTGESVRFEQYLQANNRWYDCVGYQYKPDHFVAAFLEITASKQAETALRESEATLSKVQEVAHLGSWEIDMVTKVVNASDEAHRIYGFGQGAMTLESIQSVPLPEFRPSLDAALVSLITQGKPYDVEFKIKRHSDGQIRDIHSMAEYIATSHKVIGSLQDITEHKRAEVSIQQRVMELETLNRISHILRGISKQEEMLSIILDEALAILKTTHGSIELNNRQSENLEKAVVRGWIAQLDEPPQNHRQGIAGRVFTSGEIYLSPEFFSDPQTNPESRSQIPPEWGGVSLPIRASQQSLGVLTVSVPTERELNQDEIRLLSILSEMAGAALHRMQLHTETARRAEEFAALYQTSNAISAENELGTLLQSIVEQARALLKAASSGMYLYVAQSDELVLTVDTASYLTIGTRLKKGEGVGGWVAQTHKPLRIDDYSIWEGRSPHYSDNNIRAVLEVPMLYGGELIGVLAVDEIGDSKRIYSESDERLLSLFASQAAGAIHSSRLYEQTVHRLEHVQALRVVDQAIASSHDMRLALNILLTQTISQLNVSAADVLLRQPGSNILSLTAGRGFHTLLFESFHFEDSFAARALREQRTIKAVDIHSIELHENPAFENLWMKEGFVCYWCVPLIVNGDIKGVLEVFCRTFFTPDTEWLEFLEALAGQAAITIANTQLFENLQRANQDLNLAYDATIEGWSRAMDLRDHETEGHTLRVTDMTLKLACEMQVDESHLVAIRRGALLHDIGKMGIPDAILLKAGTLNEVEWMVMRQHPQHAHDMLAPIEYLRDAIDIPYCHHEKWDGSGYPQGLQGEHIPLFARIFAIVDVWDALTSDRPYRKKWTKLKTQQYLREQSGKHFDPKIVEIFLKYIEHQEC